MHKSTASPHIIVVPGNGPVCDYAILNERRLKQLDELMDRLAHPDGGLAGSGDLYIRIQEGRLRFARSTPYPVSVGFPGQPNGNGHKTPAVGLKIMDEKIARSIDAMLSYLVGWGNGDLHILIFNGEYQTAIPVPDIFIER